MANINIIEISPENYEDINIELVPALDKFIFKGLLSEMGSNMLENAV